MMKPTVIIGGGLSGLLAGHFLRKQGADFIGLEKMDHLGGRAEIGHHRLYDPHAVELLKKEFEWLEWAAIEKGPEEFHKGTWRELENEVEGPSAFYTRNLPYFVPQKPYADLLAELRESAGRFFRTLHGVAQIFPEEGRLLCENGSEIRFGQIFWATDLAVLTKVWKGSKVALSKVIKKEPEHHAGLSFEIELEPNSFEKQNTLVFPFRFKDLKISAIGHVSNFVETTILQWTVFLPKKLFEDREEVAKCVRSLKREVYKEFPALLEKRRNERIVYLPSISGERPQETDTLEILPNLIYFGPQLKLRNEDSSRMNLDLTLHNLGNFLGLVNGNAP